MVYYAFERVCSHMEITIETRNAKNNTQQEGGGSFLERGRLLSLRWLGRGVAYAKEGAKSNHYCRLKIMKDYSFSCISS